MAHTVKYPVDQNGQKASVLVPITTLTKMNTDYDKLQNKLKVLLGIQSAFNEVKLSDKSGNINYRH